MIKDNPKVLLQDFLVESDVDKTEKEMVQNRPERVQKQRAAPTKKHISTKVVTTSNIITSILKE